MPYGELYEETIYDEDFSNSYRFTGQGEDQETGLYYYGARYYGAGVGRFMSQDPAVYDERLFPSDDGFGLIEDPQSLNAYAYVRNNPVKYVDPNGEAPKFMWGMLANCWDTVGHDVSADFLRLSIKGNTSTQKFYNDSYVADAIRNSDTYSYS